MGSAAVNKINRMFLKKSELNALSKIANEWRITICNDMYELLTTSSSMLEVTEEMKRARDALSLLTDDDTKTDQIASAIGLYERHIASIGLSIDSRDSLYKMLRAHT